MVPSDALIAVKNAVSDVMAEGQQAAGLLLTPLSLPQWIAAYWVGVGIELRKDGTGAYLDEFALTLQFATALPVPKGALRVAIRAGLPVPLKEIDFEIRVTGPYRPLGGVPALPLRLPHLSIGVALKDGEGRYPSGTLGGVVMQGAVRYVLSNNHILYLNRDVPNGQTASVDLPSPAFDDAYTTQNAVGKVRALEAFCRLHPGLTKNAGDYAIAEVTNGALLPVGTVDGMKALTSRQPIRPGDAVKMKVWKAGAASGVSRGTITGVHQDLSMFYGSMQDKYRFGDQILIASDTPGKAFSDPGDSGSLVVTDAGDPVGILFAKSKSGSVASPLTGLFTALGLSFVLPGDA